MKPRKEQPVWSAWSKDAKAIDELCRRLADGETQMSIAASLGISRSMLTQWILAVPERSVRAREARTQASGAFDEMALQEIQGATDPFSLAKAREIAQHYRWKASKADPLTYGDRTTLAGDPNAPLVPKTVITMTEEQLLTVAAQGLEKK